MDDRYIAGLFDGEGYVRIAKWQKPNSTHVRYNVFVGLGMTYRPVIETLHREFGGTLTENRHDKRNPNARIQFTWMAASQVAASFLRRVLPYLVVKKEEAEIALVLQEHIDANPYTPVGRYKTRENRDQLLAFREDLFQEISALKKRSFPSLTA